MAISTSAIEKSTLGLHPLEQYEPLIGLEATERILHKAGRRRQRASRPRQLDVLWRRRHRDPDAAHADDECARHRDGLAPDPGHARFLWRHQEVPQRLAGRRAELSAAERAIYEQVVFENATRLHLDRCDAVIVHDPQPMALVAHFPERRIPWLWQCHVDLSSPDAAMWDYLRGFVEQYDSAVFSLPEYAQDLGIEQRYITPAINPFSAKNAELSDAEIEGCLAHYRIPTDRPLVTQISRFDRWKDPMGVIEAFHKAHEQVDCTLVLVGNTASDDPEGDVVLQTIRNSIDERVVVVTADDPLLVNALQRRAGVVLQKSTREGFGLTVTEAMWKGAAVIGGNVGGIRRQIRDGENGFLVSTVDQASKRIVQVLRDPALRQRLGARARETVRENFLMSRLLEDWLDLLAIHWRQARL